MSCILNTKTNKEDSILFKTLQEIVKKEGGFEDDAINYYNQFTHLNEEGELASHIVVEFGDYVTAYNNKDFSGFENRLDENGEPKLFFEKKLSKYYYLDKNNNKIIFPPTQTTLVDKLGNNKVDELISSMALSYVEENYDFSTKTFSFEEKDTVTDITEFISSYIDETLDGIYADTEASYELVEDSVTLEEIKDSTTEIEQRIIQFFKTLKVDVKFEEESMEEQETEIKGEVVRKASFLKSSKTNVAANIKLLLSLIPDTDTNYFGTTKYVSFDDIYSTLNKSLAGVVPIISISEEGSKTRVEVQDSFDLYMDIIDEVSNTKPYLKVLKYLVEDTLADSKNTEQDKEVFKSQFTATFRLHKNNFLGSQTTQTKEGKEFSVLNLSEVGGRRGKIQSAWGFRMANMMDTAEFISNASNLSNYIKAINNSATINDETYLEVLQDLNAQLSGLGIQMSNDALDYYLSGLSPKTQTTDSKRARLTKLAEAFDYAVDKVKDLGVDEIVKSEAEFKKLADAEAYYMEESSDASVHTTGKTRWIYSNFSYLSYTIQGWKSNPVALLQHYRDSGSIATNSVYMKELLAMDEYDPSDEEWEDEVKSRLSKLELGIFNSTQDKIKNKEAVESSEMGVSDSLHDYVNKLLGSKVWHKTALAADNSTEYQVSYGIKEFEASSVRFENGEYTDISKDALYIFSDYFLDELNRINDVLEENKDDSIVKIPHYHGKNGTKSQLFPSLNPNTPLADKIGLYNYILDSKGDSVVDSVNTELSSEQLAQVQYHIKDILVGRLNNLTDVLDFHEIIEKDKNAQSLGNKSISNSALKNKTVEKAVADAYLNSLISQVEYMKMFTGDMAYYKNAVDYEKRAKAPYTDGLIPRVTSEKDLFYNISVIHSVEGAEPNANYMYEYANKALADDYASKNAVNQADAQAWITHNRWKNVLVKEGKWSDTHDSFYEKATKQVNPEFTAKELKVASQPLKGVAFEVVKGVPHYLKYSQAVLMPNLVSGTPLEKVAALMERDGVDELLTRDAIKVGYREPILMHDETTGAILEDLSGIDLKQSKVRLRNDFWKIQQDLPVKTFKDIDTGSQIMKNIFQGLSPHMENDNVRFNFLDNALSAEEMVHTINSIVNAMVTQGSAKLYKRFGIDPNTKEIKNPEALFKNVVEQLEERKDTPMNKLAPFILGASPYANPAGQKLFQNAFSSIVKSEIIKIKTNGAALIQMADFGLSYQEAKDTDGIKLAPWFTDKRLSVPKVKKDADGNVVLGPNGKQLIDPAGIFISGALIAKYVPGYASMSQAALFGTEENDYNDGLIDKEILENIIGYRIPNQGLPSNDAFKVMGILPESQGDTVVAYAGITKKTGSDYDIDKMYMMVPSFRGKPKSKEKVNEYVKNELKGATIADTYNNYADFLEKYDIESSKEFYELEDKLEDSEENRLALLRFLQEDVTNALLDSTENSELNELKEGLDLDKIEKLEYVQPSTAPISTKTRSLLVNEDPKALQNLLIKSYKSVLLNNDVIDAVMSPLDMVFFSNDINNLNKQAEPGDLEAFDPFTSLETKDGFKSAKTGLGVAVNNTGDMTRGAIAALSLGINTGLGLDGAKLDMEVSEELTKEELEFYKQSYNEIADEESQIDDAYLATVKSVPLADSMIAISNAMVDVANDPTIIKGNWNSLTNAVALMAIRQGMHPFKVNALLSSQVLKDFVKNKQKNEAQNTETIKNFNKVFLAEKVADILDSIGEPIVYKNRNREDLSSEELLEATEGINIRAVLESKDLGFKVEGRDLASLSLKELREAALRTADDTTTDTLYGDYVLLIDFLDLVRPAKAVSDNVTASRTDVDGKGKDNAAIILYINRLRKMLSPDSDLNGFESKFSFGTEGETTLTAQGAFVKYGLLDVFEVMQANPKFFLQTKDGYVKTFNYVSKLRPRSEGKEVLKQDTADEILAAHYSYLMSSSPAFAMDGLTKNKLLIKMSSRYVDLLDQNLEEVENSRLFQELFLNKSIGNQFYLIIPNVKRPSSVDEDIMNSWERHLNSENEEVKKFAEDLVKYSYIASGLGQTFSNLYEYIPYTHLNKLKLDDYFTEISKNTSTVDWNFIDQFYRHKIKDDSSLAQFVSFKGPNKVESLPSTLTTLSTNTVFRVQMENPAYIVKAGEAYYKYLGELTTGMEDKKNSVYVQTTELGYSDGKGNRFVEYNMQSPATREHISDYTGASESAIYSEAMEKAIKAIQSKLTYDPKIFDVVDEVNYLDPIKQVYRNIIDGQAKDITYVEPVSGEVTAPQAGGVEDTLFQLKDEVIAPAIRELDTFLLDFLKGFNVKSEEFDELKSKLGVDAFGATDILNKLIWVTKERNVETVPEEAAHMLITLMGSNHSDVKRLLGDIEQWEEYESIKEKYLPIYNNDLNKVKIEAVGKLVSKALVNTYKANGLDSNKLKKTLKSLLAAFKSLLTNFKWATGFASSEHIADKIAINVLSGNKNYIYNLKESFKLLDFSTSIEDLNVEEELKANPLASSIIDTFSTKNVKVTGSLAIAETENIKRLKGQGIHDLDFVVKDRDVYEKEVLPNLPENAVPLHMGWEKDDYTTYAYLIPEKGYKIENVVRGTNGWASRYLLVDENGVGVDKTQKNIVSTDFFVYNESDKSKAFVVDTKFTPASVVYEGKMSLTNKNNPYLFNRDKDQKDYVLRNPNLTVNFSDRVFYQLSGSSNLESSAESSTFVQPDNNDYLEGDKC